MQKLTYKTHGTCAREIVVTIDNGTVAHVEFVGGCSGNTSGVAALIVGMPVEEAIHRLRGIRCGSKPTSCPDQLSYALEECLAQTNQ